MVAPDGGNLHCLGEHEDNEDNDGAEDAAANGGAMDGAGGNRDAGPEEEDDDEEDGGRDCAYGRDAIGNDGMSAMPFSLSATMGTTMLLLSSPC